MPFEVMSPGVDERVLPQETPLDTSVRLARAKARAVSTLRPHAVVIGSDQVACVDGVVVGKPGTHERAREQLKAMRGRAVDFHTAVAVVRSDTGFEQADVVTVKVVFRLLTDAQIERYLRLEQPYDCAGSARSEGLGVALLEAVSSDDATALIGLPLIRTCDLLRAAGLDPLET